MLFYAAPPGAPQSLSINMGFIGQSPVLSWLPPLESERHGNILNYTINCSSQNLIEPQTIQMSYPARSNPSVILSSLHPFTTYNCCVSANNDQGKGLPICQLVVTAEAGTVNILAACVNTCHMKFFLHEIYCNKCQVNIC